MSMAVAWKALVLTLAAIVLGASPVYAFTMEIYEGPGFEGNEITLEGLFPNQGTIDFGPESALVDRKQEEFPSVPIPFDCGPSQGGPRCVAPASNSRVAISLTNFTILFDFTYSASGSVFKTGDFNGFQFTDTNGTVPEIVNVTIDPWVSKNSDFENITFNWTADSIIVDFDEIAVNPSTRYKLNVEFVPEPQTALLLGLGLAGLAHRRAAQGRSRRRGRQQGL